MIQVTAQLVLVGECEKYSNCFIVFTSKFFFLNLDFNLNHETFWTGQILRRLVTFWSEVLIALNLRDGSNSLDRIRQKKSTMKMSVNRPWLDTFIILYFLPGTIPICFCHSKSANYKFKMAWKFAYKNNHVIVFN